MTKIVVLQLCSSYELPGGKLPVEEVEKDDFKIPEIEIPMDIMKRSHVFKDILDDTLDHQNLCIGKYFDIENMKKVIEFIEECHRQGYMQDPYDERMEKNPRIPDVEGKFELPLSAKQILIERNENGKLNIELLQSYLQIGKYFLFYQVMEAFAQIVVDETKKTDGSESEILNLFGVQGPIPDSFKEQMKMKYPNYF